MAIGKFEIDINANKIKDIFFKIINEDVMGKVYVTNKVNPKSAFQKVMNFIKLMKFYMINVYKVLLHMILFHLLTQMNFLMSILHMK